MEFVCDINSRYGFYSSRLNKMANAWLTHVKKTMSEMKHRGTYKKGDGLKKVILEAKKTYKRHGSTGAPAKKTRRHRKSRKSFF